MRMASVLEIFRNCLHVTWIRNRSSTEFTKLKMLAVTSSGSDSKGELEMGDVFLVQVIGMHIRVSPRKILMGRKACDGSGWSEAVVSALPRFF
jgi:hypothetical protein